MIDMIGKLAEKVATDISRRGFLSRAGRGAMALSGALAALWLGPRALAKGNCPTNQQNIVKIAKAVTAMGCTNADAANAAVAALLAQNVGQKPFDCDGHCPKEQTCANFATGMTFMIVENPAEGMPGHVDCHPEQTLVHQSTIPVPADGSGVVTISCKCV